MTAYQTMLIQLLKELKALLESDISGQLKDLLEELIERLELHLQAAPAEPHPNLDALINAVLEAIRALIAAVGAYLESLKDGSPDQRSSALKHVVDCAAGVNTALDNLERALRPPPPRPF
ncbi:TPA: hypothetical protein QEL11_003748 [Stenotrophomonas maltophilia]|uniref:hypothetical protein n=1 Tax=Stenotrophomonas maltophilia TaxID=40324 RepID=UPI0031B98551|nr:hypothetical protein [Stenotrophomonas maltophilia]HDS1559839.1 hypothetical protein [Stenotrophomonas maltophilia]